MQNLLFGKKCKNEKKIEKNKIYFANNIVLLIIFDYF